MRGLRADVVNRERPTLDDAVKERILRLLDEAWREYVVARDARDVASGGLRQARLDFERLIDELRAALP